MDKQQSWEWVTQHRLPLFLRSDLYSEYKLCKLLTVHALEPCDTTTASVSTDTLRPQKSPSATRLYSSKKIHAELLSKGSSSAVCLPSLSPRSDHEDLPPVATGSTLPSSTSLSHISGSKSDIELGSKGQQQRSSGPLKSLSQQKLPQKQLTADIPWIMLDEESPEKVEGRRRSSRSATVKDSMRMTAEDFDFIGTKSGMSALWKFLWGTMGERNWLFWVDAERIQYYTKPINRQRYNVCITSFSL